MLSFVSRGRWKDTVWRRGFSLSSHAVGFIVSSAASGSYYELLPAVCGQVGDGPWHLSPSSFSDTPGGFAVRHRHRHRQSAARLCPPAPGRPGVSCLLMPPPLRLFSACLAAVDQPWPRAPQEGPHTVGFSHTFFDTVRTPAWGGGPLLILSLCPEAFFRVLFTPV